MYHVIANLELMFRSLEEALAWAESRPEFRPKVPATAMCGEDLSVPRVCGAPRIEDCITALGVTGTFRRCLNADPNAKSYENDDEAYPILVAEFDDGLDWSEPTKSQVPDVSVTHERWLLEPARPMKIELKWLDAYSLRMRDAGLRMACTKARFLDDVSGYSHPWLDGRGHPLDCPGMGGDPWPDPERLAGEIYLDMRLGGHLGFASPAWPLDGTWLFTPFDEGMAPYRTYQDSLRRFTGCADMNGEPVFEDYAMKWGPDSATRKFGDVRYEPRAGWRVVPWDGSPAIPFPAEGNILDGMLVHIGHALNRGITIPEIFRTETPRH